MSAGLDVGTGLTVLGIAATVMTAIIKFGPTRKVQTNGHVTKELCDARYNQLHDDIVEVKKDVKTLLTRSV